MATTMELILVLGLIIGAGCQNVRLVGGPPDMPNAGRIEISINGTWHEICYRGDNTTSDLTWNIKNVITACRQLGYPGAGLAGGGRFGDGLLGQSVDNFRCEGDENSLLKCDHDIPQNVSCQTNDSAYAICTVPGYLGCFVDQLPRAMPYGELEMPADMSITNCIKHCRTVAGIPKYAGVQDARQCFCGMNDTEYNRHGKAAEEDCSRKPCPGNENQACGWIWKMAVYDITKGYCEDIEVPQNSTRYMSGNYPQFGSSALFVCEPGFVLLGHNITQCVVGSEPDEVAWSNEEPFCADERYLTTTPSYTSGISTGLSTSTHGGKDPPNDTNEGKGKTNLLAALFGALGFVLFILILITIIMIIFLVVRGRKKTRHKLPANSRRAEEARVNAGYTDESDPHSTRIVTISNGHHHPPPADDHTHQKDVVLDEDTNYIDSNIEDSGVAGLHVIEDGYREIPEKRTSRDSGSSLNCKEDEMCDTPDEVIDELKEAKEMHVASNLSTDVTTSKQPDDIGSDVESIATNNSADDRRDETDEGPDDDVTVPDAAGESSSNNELETVSSGYNSDHLGTVLRRDSSDEGMHTKRTVDTDQDEDGVNAETSSEE